LPDEDLGAKFVGTVLGGDLARMSGRVGEGDSKRMPSNWRKVFRTLGDMGNSCFAAAAARCSLPGVGKLGGATKPGKREHSGRKEEPSKLLAPSSSSSRSCAAL
jgi:hypothetical protein